MKTINKMISAGLNLQDLCRFGQIYSKILMQSVLEETRNSEYYESACEDMKRMGITVPWIFDSKRLTQTKYRDRALRFNKMLKKIVCNEKSKRLCTKVRELTRFIKNPEEIEADKIALEESIYASFGNESSLDPLYPFYNHMEEKYIAI